MKRNNRGFTLIELLVALAILGILSVAVIGFVSAGTSSYRSVSTSVSLQTESQLAMNQIRQYLVDCNGGVAYANGAFYILDQETDDENTVQYTVHAFLLRDSAIYYSKNAVTKDETGFQCSIAAGDKLCGHVSALTAETGAPGQTAKVTLDLNLGNSGKHYEAKQTTALRNSVYAGVSLPTLLSTVCK